MEKIEAMRFAIKEMENKQAAVSIGRKRMDPTPGCEELFWKLDEAIIQLKAICQAIQAESVRKSIAEWQMEIMEKPDAVETAMMELVQGETYQGE